MTIHLIKLSVGPESLSELAGWQAQRVKDMQRKGQAAELMHITRQMPKRAEELLEGGSIYWVIKGYIVARQRLVELRPLVRDGVPYCGLVYDAQVVTVQMRPRKAFQGWRYLEAKDAPPDIGVWDGTHAMPDTLQRELMALGLL